MSLSPGSFIPRNDGFACEQCQIQVIPADGTFRNHCPVCLTSKHVDHHTPGDRLSPCAGLMPTIAVEGTDPDQLDLIQQCITCHKLQRNRMAGDDNKEAIFALLENKK